MPEQDTKFNMLWQMIANQARLNLMLLPLEDLRELRQAFEHSETIGPFVDPLAYREMLYDGRMKRNRELLDATIKYIAALDAMRDAEIRTQANREMEVARG